MSTSVSKETLLAWMRQSAAVLEENKSYLTELDSAIGDADHGTNIARGFKTVVEKLDSMTDEDIGTLFKTAAMTMMSAVGGASGMLYGNFFMKAAAKANGKDELNQEELLAVLDAGVTGIEQRGRAGIGDKTMMDVWLPSLEALKSGLADHGDLTAALAATNEAAKTGMESTIPLVARKGRASYLGERSAGHQDPGATSSYLIINALKEVVNAG